MDYWGGVNCAWADDVVIPTPVYFNDFSFAISGQDNIEIVGSGAFETDTDERFGKFYHNDPNNETAIRTNYLKLPGDVLSHSTETKAMTIGFWVNKKNENDYWFTPLFGAYGAAPSGEGNTNTWPMFVCETRGLIQLNCAGYCDFGINDNPAGTSYNDGTPYVSTTWLDDAKWHYYTIVLTETTAKVYVDGELKNGWTVDGTSDGQKISGLFSAGNTLSYICLGGNQAWNWNDADPAFGFDDFAVYNVALSAEQIAQIISNKKERNVTGTQIGKMDNSTDYLGALSDKMTLKPGDKYHYSFINYNKGDNNWNNWVLPVYDANDNRVITVRADNYEDMHHVGDTWGSNAGCTSDFNWTNFPGNMDGANVDMTVTFNKDKVFNMTSTISTVDGSTWNYSYANDYENSPISLTNNDNIKVALSVSRSWIDLLSEGYSAVGATIGSTGYTTFSSSYPLNLTGIDAYYIASVGSDKAMLTKATGTVAAGTGLILAGTAGDVLSIPVAASGDAINDNLLVGCPTATDVTTPDVNAYVLVNNNGDAEFQPLSGTSNGNKVTIPAGKAYLYTIANNTGANLRVVSAGDATGIANIEAAKAENGAMFNMAGQRVNGSYKGIVIKNGKKVLVK